MMNYFDVWILRVLMSLTTHSFRTYFHFSTASSTGDISWRLKIQRKIRRGSAPPSSPTGLSPGVGKKVPVHKLDHVLINSHSHEVCVVCFLQEAHISKGPSLLRSSLLEMLARKPSLCSTIQQTLPSFSRRWERPFSIVRSLEWLESLCWMW